MINVQMVSQKVLQRSTLKHTPNPMHAKKQQCATVRQVFMPRQPLDETSAFVGQSQKQNIVDEF